MSGFVDMDGPVFVAGFGASGPPMVLVHGLGSSHAHWLAVSRALASHHRVYVPDLPGFGRSPLAGRDASVTANARLLSRFVEELQEPAILVGNSMGALLTMLVADDRPDDVAGLVLVAPLAPRPWLMPMERDHALLFSAYCWPGIGEWTRRQWVSYHGPHGMVRSVFEECCTAPSAVPSEVEAAALAIADERASHDDDIHAFLAAYRSTLPYLLTAARLDRLVRRIRVPTFVIHGTHDKLVPAMATRRLRRVRPDWTYSLVDGVGHMPHVDDAPGFVRIVNDWLAENPHAAASDARGAVSAIA
jgi:pimeloyl-ACP methyl ester carboxylesterase